MIDETVKLEFSEELKRSRDGRAACLEALKAVQRRNGWVSDEDVAGLSKELGISEAEIDSLATCYNMIFRRPVGRNTIFLCDSVSCWILGYEQIREQVFMKLGTVFGQTTADGRFTVLPISCIGACDKGAAMIVNGELHTNLEPETVGKILDNYK